MCGLSTTPTHDSTTRFPVAPGVLLRGEHCTPGTQQVLLLHELPAVLDQAAQDGERLRREGDHLVLAQELLVGEIQTVGVERQVSITIQHRRSNRFLTVL